MKSHVAIAVFCLAFIWIGCKGGDNDGPDGDEVSAAPPEPSTAATKGQTYRWTFDDMPAGGAAKGFTAPLGTWSVSAEPSAPSAPNVFRQTGHFSDPEFPRAFVPALEFSD